MDTLLRDGQHHLSLLGIPQMVTGVEELLQQASIRLGIEKGAFLYDSALGSQLHKLQRGPQERMDRQALSYAEEALRPMKGVTAHSATCRFPSPDELSLTICLAIDNKLHDVEVKTNGTL